jgi:hypothetical protein
VVLLIVPTSVFGIKQNPGFSFSAHLAASYSNYLYQETGKLGGRWLTPVILATQEAAIRRIMVQSQPRQIVHETLYQKNPSQKRAGRVT